MRRYRLEIDNVRAHLRSLFAVIGLQFVVIGLLGYGWNRAPDRLIVHIPPDLRSGAVMAPGDVPAANVYAFAFYIFQQLNRWPEDGARDYGRALFRVSPYLTPRYRTELMTDMELKGRQGELVHRVRGVQEVTENGYESRRVEVLAPGVWVVWLDLELTESVRGMTVKQAAIRYPLRVVRLDIDPETNPWGLALDGFAGDGPRRLTASEPDPTSR